MSDSMWYEQDELCLVTAVLLYGFDWRLVATHFNRILLTIYGPNVNKFDSRHCKSCFKCLERKYVNLRPRSSKNYFKHLTDMLHNELIKKHLNAVESDIDQWLQKHRSETSSANQTQLAYEKLKNAVLELKEGNFKTKCFMIYRAATTSRMRLPFFKHIWNRATKPKRFNFGSRDYRKPYMMFPIIVGVSCEKAAAVEPFGKFSPRLQENLEDVTLGMQGVLQTEILNLNKDCMGNPIGLPMDWELSSDQTADMIDVHKTAEEKKIFDENCKRLMEFVECDDQAPKLCNPSTPADIQLNNYGLAEILASIDRCDNEDSYTQLCIPIEDFALYASTEYAFIEYELSTEKKLRLSNRKFYEERKAIKSISKRKTDSQMKAKQRKTKQKKTKLTKIKKDREIQEFKQEVQAADLKINETPKMINEEPIIIEENTNLGIDGTNNIKQEETVPKKMCASKVNPENEKLEMNLNAFEVQKINPEETAPKLDLKPELKREKTKLQIKKTLTTQQKQNCENLNAANENTPSQNTRSLTSIAAQNSIEKNSESSQPSAASTLQEKLHPKLISFRIMQTSLVKALKSGSNSSSLVGKPEIALLKNVSQSITKDQPYLNDKTTTIEDNTNFKPRLAITLHPVVDSNTNQSSIQPFGLSLQQQKAILIAQRKKATTSKDVLVFDNLLKIINQDIELEAQVQKKKLVTKPNEISTAIPESIQAQGTDKTIFNTKLPTIVENKKLLSNSLSSQCSLPVPPQIPATSTMAETISEIQPTPTIQLMLNKQSIKKLSEITIIRNTAKPNAKVLLLTNGQLLLPQNMIFNLVQTSASNPTTSTLAMNSTAVTNSYSSPLANQSLPYISSTSTGTTSTLAMNSAAVTNSYSSPLANQFQKSLPYISSTSTGTTSTLAMNSATVTNSYSSPLANQSLPYISSTSTGTTSTLAINSAAVTNSYSSPLANRSLPYISSTSKNLAISSNVFNTSSFPSPLQSSLPISIQNTSHQTSSSSYSSINYTKPKTFQVAQQQSVLNVPPSPLAMNSSPSFTIASSSPSISTNFGISFNTSVSSSFPSPLQSSLHISGMTIPTKSSISSSRLISCSALNSISKANSTAIFSSHSATPSKQNFATLSSLPALSSNISNSSSFQSSLPNSTGTTNPSLHTVVVSTPNATTPSFALNSTAVPATNRDSKSFLLASTCTNFGTSSKMSVSSNFSSPISKITSCTQISSSFSPSIPNTNSKTCQAPQLPSLAKPLALSHYSTPSKQNQKTLLLTPTSTSRNLIISSNITHNSSCSLSIQSSLHISKKTSQINTSNASLRFIPVLASSVIPPTPSSKQDSKTLTPYPSATTNLAISSTISTSLHISKKSTFTRITNSSLRSAPYSKSKKPPTAQLEAVKKLDSSEMPNGVKEATIKVLASNPSLKIKEKIIKM